jgi:hypothetical protein
MRLMAHQTTTRWLALARCLTLALLALALCGCLGGTVAQQLVRSMLLHGADSATAAAIDANEEKQKLAAQNMPMKDTIPDKYDLAFINTGFQEVTPQIEPLPQRPFDEEKPVQLMQEAKLVQVEVWSLLIGDEKQQFLETAKKQGSTELPPENEWQESQIAIGATSDSKPNKQEVITFWIPAEIGKLHSGSKAVVELSTSGQLSIARYAVK